MIRFKEKSYSTFLQKFKLARKGLGNKIMTPIDNLGMQVNRRLPHITKQLERPIQLKPKSKMQLKREVIESSNKAKEIAKERKVFINHPTKYVKKI